MDNWASAYVLVNVLSLSNTILTCSECILGCLWPCSTNGADAKSIDRGACTMIANIRSTYTRNIYIRNICAVGIWIRYTSIRTIFTEGICAQNTCIDGVKIRVLAGLEIILVGQRVNDYYLWLFMKLIFVLIDRMICWDG